MVNLFLFVEMVDQLQTLNILQKLVGHFLKKKKL